MHLGNPIVVATLGVWVALELGLLARDALRGKGGTGSDRGTRRLNFAVIPAAMVLAGFVAGVLRHHSALWLPGGDGNVPLAVGLAIMWLGLTLRVWSIATLGAEFRTTVEVDADQRLVERGPYRLLRHPSYTGLLLTATGYGIVTAVWPALAVAVLGPAAVLVLRIRVEERVLVDAMGDAYRDYRRRTSRLLPGIW